MKRTLAKIALAAILTPAVLIGVTALPLAGVAGAGVGAVAPAYAELEPLPLKSYSEEFSSGLAPVNSVRGELKNRGPFSIQTIAQLVHIPGVHVKNKGRRPVARFRDLGRGG